MPRYSFQMQFTKGARGSACDRNSLGKLRAECCRSRKPIQSRNEWGANSITRTRLRKLSFSFALDRPSSRCKRRADGCFADVGSARDRSTQRIPQELRDCREYLASRSGGIPSVESARNHCKQVFTRRHRDQRTSEMFSCLDLRSGFYRNALPNFWRKSVLSDMRHISCTRTHASQSVSQVSPRLAALAVKSSRTPAAGWSSKLW